MTSMACVNETFSFHLTVSSRNRHKLVFRYRSSFLCFPPKIMSADNIPNDAPSPSHSNNSSTASDASSHGPLYQSLEECLKHPRCISNKWLNEVSDVQNSPRTLKNAPYNDGALYWVDEDNNLLSMAFPAVLETDGKFSKIGPYFNLAGDREIKVGSFFFIKQKKKKKMRALLTATNHPCLE